MTDKFRAIDIYAAIDADLAVKLNEVINAHATAHPQELPHGPTN
jgi:hypothetical protein